MQARSDPRHPSWNPPRRWHAGVALVWGLALGRPATAAHACTVELTGTESVAWQSAAEALDRELRERRLLSNCTRVSLDAADGLARLTFTTDDGRSAERWINHPIELVPTVQALSISVPASESDAQPEPRRLEPKQPPSSAPRSTPPPQGSPSTRDGAGGGVLANANPYALSPLFGAGVGFRGGANRLITPMLSGSIALSIDRWELGLVGRYEAHYVATTGEKEGSPETSGLVLGSTFGFRQSVGNFALRGGGMLLLAVLEEDDDAKSGRAEGRVGIYTGGVYPRASKFRFRLDLGAELVPYNIGRSEQNAQGDWSLPWWAITCTLGLELG